MTSINTELKKDSYISTQMCDFKIYSVMNSVQDQIALLDQDGVITAVNKSWLDFGEQNQSFHSYTFIGRNYFELLAQLIETPDTSPEEREDARHILKGMKEVLSGACLNFLWEYPCHSPTEKRWFEVIVVRFQQEKGGLVVAHRNITSHKNLEVELKQSNAELKKLKEQTERERDILADQVNKNAASSNLIGASDSLKYVLNRVQQVAPTDAPVLIMGETGTGKELIAHAVHKASTRSSRPMLTVNCASLPATLIESELFGYDKGAFSGAAKRHSGLFQTADGSTLFLDEITEIPIELQAKLLRVLQNGEFLPLGSNTTIKVDVRIIAASNRKLDVEVKEGRFREDLYYRINVVPVTLPPLRQREGDIPLLVDFFIAKYNKKFGKQITSIKDYQLSKLQRYSWPGNIRELENVIERSVILSSTSTFTIFDDLSTDRQDPKWPLRSKSLSDVEKVHILDVLEATEWKVEGPNGAAHVLEIPPSTLRDRIKKLGIHRFTD
jgi:transcriptional regulator with GAF, ATPase, and Fis domain